MQIVAKRADEIKVGDVIDTHCGIADHAYDTVIAVRIDKRSGEVEITTNSGAISPTIRRRASRPLDVVLH